MKLLILLILSVSILFASSKSDHLRIQILETIITQISIDKDKVIWSDNKDILNQLDNHNKIKTTHSCEYATIIILQNKNNLPKECENKYIFTLDYKLLSDTKQSFGALFWKKGRPNIVILEPRINKQNIKVSKDLEPYLEDRLW